MRFCIHRGTQEIGGTCVEIESQGKRLVLDVGLPLDDVAAATMDLHPVPGFDKPDARWRSKYEDVVRHEESWARLCAKHRKG
jgi:mRNA degradation ribonuclease J1/J2